MTTRTHIANRVREVGALAKACPQVPVVVGQGWPDVLREIELSLARGDSARARRLADEWADLALQALSSQLLHVEGCKEGARPAPTVLSEPVRPRARVQRREARRRL